MMPDGMESKGGGSLPHPRTTETTSHTRLFQWKSHQKSHPSIAHSPRLSATAKIHGQGDEKRITLLRLPMSTFKRGGQ